MLDNLVKYLIKSDFVRAKILAAVRGLVKVGGTYLITKGLADSGMVEAASGLATLAVGFYLSNEDVKNVDAKIIDAKAEGVEIGLAQPSPIVTPEQEINETLLLNIQLRHGIGK